jgi:hypothetical protein
MAVTMKNTVVWDVDSCGPFENQRFGESIASIIMAKRITEQGSIDLHKSHTASHPRRRRSSVTAAETSNHIKGILIKISLEEILKDIFPSIRH